MNNDTVLLRQVNPSWIQQGRITSQVFKPTPKDNKRLSVYDGDLITAENAWKHFVNKLSHASAGVLGVTAAECQSHGLSALSDPVPFPEHAVIAFNGLSETQIKSKAKLLRAAADSRGWLYQAENAA